MAKNRCSNKSKSTWTTTTWTANLPSFIVGTIIYCKVNTALVNSINCRAKSKQIQFTLTKYLGVVFDPLLEAPQQRDAGKCKSSMVSDRGVTVFGEYQVDHMWHYNVFLPASERRECHRFSHPTTSRLNIDYHILMSIVSIHLKTQDKYQNIFLQIL